APAAAPAAETATSATAAAAPAGTLLRDVDLQSAPVEVAAVQSLDRRLGVGRAAHLDEREASRLARVAIRYDLDVNDIAPVRSECRAERGLVRAERQIAYIESCPDCHPGFTSKPRRYRTCAASTTSLSVSSAPRP